MRFPIGCSWTWLPYHYGDECTACTAFYTNPSTLESGWVNTNCSWRFHLPCRHDITGYFTLTKTFHHIPHTKENVRWCPYGYSFTFPKTPRFCYCFRYHTHSIHSILLLSISCTLYTLYIVTFDIIHTLYTLYCYFRYHTHSIHSILLLYCYYIVTILLLYCYYIVTILLLYCYYIVTILLLYCYYIVTILLLYCYYIVTMLLLYCYYIVTILLLYCYYVVTILLLYCYYIVTILLLYCYYIVTILLLYCYYIVTILLLYCYYIVTILLLYCYYIVTILLLSPKFKIALYHMLTSVTFLNSMLLPLQTEAESGSPDDTTRCFSCVAASHSRTYLY